MAFDPEKREELEKLRRLVALKRANGLAFYQPHEKQALFHAAAYAKRRYLRTGNRFGKSTCGAAEDVAFALGERPWLSKDDPNRYIGIPRRSTTGLILVADWDKAREVFTNPAEGRSLGKLWQFLPKDAIKIKPHKNQAGEIDCIFVESVHGGTSAIYLDTVKSYKSNPMGQESSSWDWIHVDEPCPKEMWEANARGLMDTDGAAWFTCTPITEPWINDFFIPPRKLKSEFIDGFYQETKSTWVLTGSSYDNTSIGKSGIDQFAAELSEGQRAARIYGRPSAYAGQIYSEIDDTFHRYDNIPHGWKNHNTPPSNYTIRVAIDPHPSTNHAVLFAATAPTGQVYFYAEYWDHPLMDGLCDAILSILNGRTPHSIICDPIAFNIDPVHGTNWASVFHARGLNVMPAPKQLEFGIQATKAALARREGSVLYFSSALSTTWAEFDKYIWDPKKPNKPIDKHDHMMECLYRLVITGLDYIPPPGEEEPEKVYPSRYSSDYREATVERDTDFSTRDYSL